MGKESRERRGREGGREVVVGKGRIYPVLGGVRERGEGRSEGEGKGGVIGVCSVWKGEGEGNGRVMVMTGMRGREWDERGE